MNLFSFSDIRRTVLGSGTFAVFAFASGLSVAAPVPARADQNAVNRNVILGSIAAVAAVLTYNNVQAKNRNQATVVLGHTGDGGTIFADGHVGYPNGDILYTGNNNGTPCNWLQGGTWCNGTPVVFYPQNYHGHDHGHHYGWYKNCHNPHNPCHGFDNDNDQGHGHGHGHGDRDDH